VVGDAAAAIDSPASKASSDVAPAGSADGGGRRAPVNQPGYVPGVAAAANQMGTHAARTILRTLAGKPRQPFHYWNKGALAVIGRNRAVADFGRVRLTGLLGWWTWVLVHIAYLAGFRNRVSVMLEWAYAYLTFRPGARLITEEERGDSSRDS
jgi:NADH dehydrogenase